MQLFLNVARATLLIPSGTAGDPDRKHLFVILNTPVTRERLTLLVSLSSIKEGCYHDPACILQPNETSHPFIKKPSFIEYSRARIEYATTIENAVDSGQFVPMGTIERDLLERIITGLINSPRTPAKCKTFAREHLLE